MNALDYIKSQIEIWGEDYVYELMENGYTPIPTTNGWKWVLGTNIVVAK